MQITGKDLIRWGYKPDKWFAEAILAAEMAKNEQEAQEVVARFVPVPAPQMRLRRENFIVPSICYRSENEEEAANCAAALAHMVEIGKLPTVRASAIMPDTCPVSQVLGTIPVGGIVATENALHPNMHSADICCSMAVSYFDAVDVKTLMDNALALTHFGFGGRARGKQTRPPEYIMEAIQNNDYLRPLASTAIEHFTTQGDGNHFFYLGQSQKDGMAMVTHHGSRGFGAKLYKKGMEVAEKFRRQIAKDVPAHNAWIPFDTIEGQIYWDALQIVRLWTRENHYAIHNMVLDSVGRSAKNRFWNEHNFVFRKEDGLFYHAKGATPAFKGFSADDSGLTLIPLNMAEPILVSRGLDNPQGLGFAPHGAGRNLSRTAYLKKIGQRPHAQVVAEETKGLDVRWFCGAPDVSELPMAYKNAASMRQQIAQFELCTIVDVIAPLGSIMAGDWQANAPWRKKVA